MPETIEQKFIRLMNELEPTLKKVSTKNRFLGFIDKDDLFQEALINLWRRLKAGQFEDKTPSYIVRSCYFHIQNYIRTHKFQYNTVSLEEPVMVNDVDVFYLKDVIRDKAGDPLEQLDSRLIVESILNNGLAKREKEVFLLLYAGLNLREAAKRLGISHVRVLKIKQNICAKYKGKFFDIEVTKK